MNEKQRTSFPNSSIPLLGCVLDILLLMISGGSDEIVSEDTANDAATAHNVAAQKHFRQPQHVRGA